VRLPWKFMAGPWLPFWLSSFTIHSLTSLPQHFLGRGAFFMDLGNKALRMDQQRLPTA
jgi:hypothetical protein